MMIRAFHSLEMLATATLALSCVALVLAVSQQRSEASYNHGRQALSDGNYQEARDRFQSAIDSGPKQPMFYVAHALAVTDELFGMVMPTNAWQSLPQLSHANSLLLNRVCQDYKSALTLSPFDSTLWSNLGWIEAFLTDDDAASAAFRQATLTDPNDAVSRIGLGLYYERRGMVDDATEQYARALVASARIVDSAFFNDLMVRSQSASMAAVDRALEILSASPQSAIVIASIAKLHAYEGKYALAEREYNNALSQLPNLSYTWTNLGTLALAQNKKKAATLDFQRALFLDEQNTLATNKLASIEFEDGNTDAAKRLYARTLLVPLYSIHAQRTWRIYHVSATESNDIFPAGLLYYIFPTVQFLPLCDDWLNEIAESETQSGHARIRVDMQQNFCSSR